MVERPPTEDGCVLAGTTKRERHVTRSCGSRTVRLSSRLSPRGVAGRRSRFAAFYTAGDAPRSCSDRHPRFKPNVYLPRDWVEWHPALSMRLNSPKTGWVRRKGWIRE